MIAFAAQHNGKFGGSTSHDRLEDALIDNFINAGIGHGENGQSVFKVFALLLLLLPIATIASEWCWWFSGSSRS